MLSLIVFLPLVAAIALAALPALSDHARVLTWLIISAIEVMLVAVVWAGYTDPGEGALALRGAARIIPRRRQQLPPRSRRPVAAARGTHRGDLSRLRRVRAERRQPPAPAGSRVPVPADREPRGVRRPGPHPLLRVLRPVDRGDVLHHLRMGARAGRALGAQVLPLYLPRLARPAPRLHRSLPRVHRAHLRHGWSWPGTAPPFGDDPVLGGLVLAAVFVGLAIKTPTVPFHTWLPPAHTDAPADRLCGACERDAQDGHLRFRAHRHAGVLPAPWRDWAPLISGGRHRVRALRGAGRPRADGPEARDRLHLGEPHGLRDPRGRCGRGSWAAVPTRRGTSPSPGPSCRW